MKANKGGDILTSLSLTCSKYKTLEPSTISAAGHVINLHRERERERERERVKENEWKLKKDTNFVGCKG